MDRPALLRLMSLWSEALEPLWKMRKVQGVQGQQFGQEEKVALRNEVYVRFFQVAPQGQDQGEELHGFQGF